MGEGPAVPRTRPAEERVEEQAEEGLIRRVEELEARVAALERGLPRRGDGR